MARDVHLSIHLGDRQSFSRRWDSSTATSPRNGEMMGAVPLEDVDYGELDGEREQDMMDLSSLDDFLHGMVETVKDNSHAETSRIKTLEKSLEDEKRRLAQMEVQLRDAKKAREAGEQTLVVHKQGKMMEGMVMTLTKATQSEMEVRQDWEEEWRDRGNELRRQQKEMEEALRRRHASELKQLQGMIAKDTKRTAMDIQKTRRAVSPRDLERAQGDNLAKLVEMFHQHGQERLFLTAKFSEQEEQLVRNKNLARQQLLAKSQSQSNSLYRKYSLPTVSVRRASESMLSTSHSQLMSRGSPTVAQSPIMSRSPGMSRGFTGGGLHSGRVSAGPRMGNPGMRSARSPGLSMTASSSKTISYLGIKREPLPSPRFETGMGASTFLTAIEVDGKDGDAREKRRQSTANREGERVYSTPPARGSAHQPASDPGPSHRDTEHSPFGHPGMTPVPRGSTGVGSEFGAGWDNTKSQLPQDKGRVAWDPRFAQGQTAPATASRKWHPNVIAFEGANTNKPRPSPYEQSLTPEPRAAPQTSDTQKSKRARSKTAQSSKTRAASTQEFRTQGWGNSSLTSTLPNIPRGGKQHPTDVNMNRPMTDAAKNDDFEPSAAEKYLKLEEWIQSKIQHVLGTTGASQDAFVSRVPSQQPQRTQHHPMALATQSFDSEDLNETDAFAASIPAYDKRGIDTRGSRDSPRSLESTTASLVSRISANELRNRVSPDEDGGDRMNELLKKVKVSDTQGLHIEGKLEALKHKEKVKEQRIGTEVDQLAEEDDITAILGASEGKFTRDGRHIDLVESEDAEGRRDKFEKTKKKSISWSTNLEAQDGGPGTAGSEQVSMRPGTTASDASSRPGTGELDDFFSKIRHNKVPAVEEMVNNGADISARDKHGNTPLMIAAQNGHKRLVKLFLRYGGDPNATNHQGNTALHFTCAYGYSALAQYRSPYRVEKGDRLTKYHSLTVISKGADDTMINNKGLSVYDGLGG